MRLILLYGKVNTGSISRALRQFSCKRPVPETPFCAEGSFHGPNMLNSIMAQPAGHGRLPGLAGGGPEPGVGYAGHDPEYRRPKE